MRVRVKVMTEGKRCLVFCFRGVSVSARVLRC